MKLEWILLAEGMGSDASGALTLIGVNRNVFVTPVLPGLTKRAAVAHIESEPGGTGPEKLQVTFSVISPEGRVLLAQTAVLSLSPPPWEDIPPSIDIPAEFGINVSEYGPHIVRVEIDVDAGQHLSGETVLYVRQSPTTAAVAPPLATTAGTS